MLIITCSSSRVEFLLVGFEKWKERERGMRRLAFAEVTRLRGSCGICPHVMRDTKNESRRQVNECIMRLLCCFVVYSIVGCYQIHPSLSAPQAATPLHLHLFLLPVSPARASTICSAFCSSAFTWSRSVYRGLCRYVRISFIVSGCCTASAGGCARCKVRGGRRLRFLKGSPPPTLSHTHVYPIF